MKSLTLRSKLLFTLSILFIVAACKQPETVVVGDNPTTIAADTTDRQDTNKNEAGFRKLLIGEGQKIYSLDPLFADNTASMRAIQLVYEGVVRLNANGEVVAGLAKDWSVSSDSLRYTFTLRPEIFYQDSEIFSTGTGRKVKAQDVKYIFKRMAKADTPPWAAQLFMDIRGFEPYYREQRMVYNPEKRSIDDISGISTPDQQTVVFQLEKKDSRFLQKLATPYAVIYPKEAVAEEPANFSPVGTGPFNFSKQPTDSTYIFSKFSNYYNASGVNLNRVDITTCSNEQVLFRALSTNKLHLTPQMGPQLTRSTIQNERLKPSYSSRYTLLNGGPITYTLRWNQHSSIPKLQAQNIGRITTSDSITFFKSLPDEYITSNPIDTTTPDTTSLSQASPIYTMYSDDPYIRTFLGSLSTTLSKQNISLKMIQHRAPTRNTGLFFTKSYPLIPDSQWDNYLPIYQFSVDQLALYRNEIEQLHFNQYPWWFDLRDVTMPATENM
ncbi:ABC transporter substrate-binding protein [Fodinibius halophilus]|uniref:ABC transporter substrate-binding protein n=1 Tax=Fodinibius halophilus TaxID=1736908 RepID=A0A6M1TB30_9BACT|nr:ABC transporter substrate-binding protein [Fodinibius halophilus]NGP89221.1 ABC transporter substrate-binding protein [Fodinibius halophilus]